MVAPPASVQALFVAVTAAMAVLVVLGVQRATAADGWSGPLRPTRPALATAAALTAWLAFTGALAASGALQRLDATPPLFALVVGPALAAVVALGIASGRGRWASGLRALPPAWLIGVQAFRIGVELVLYLLFAYGVLAALMTPEGGNFDVLAGLSAPLVAWCVARGWRRMGIAWNLLGIALLANVLLLGVVSAPSPFRVFMQEPANTVLTAFPFVWLPSFLLPLAALLHILSIRQLAARMDRPEA